MHPFVDSDRYIEPVKRMLQEAYARLRSMPPGEDTDPILQEIAQLERQLLDRYATYVEKRDSTLPPKKPS